jgi:predicted RNase H-like HicB family nuclease
MGQTFIANMRDNHLTFQPGDRSMQLTAVLIPAQEGGFVAINPETGTSTQGETIQEAMANLQEATELYLEEFPMTSYGQPLLTTFEVAVRAA